MELTQEQFIAIIARIYAALKAERDALREAGEEVSDDITPEEILVLFAEKFQMTLNCRNC